MTAERLLALLVALFVLVVGIDAGQGVQRSDLARAPGAAIASLDGSALGELDGSATVRAFAKAPEATRQAKGVDPVAVAAGLSDGVPLALARETSLQPGSPDVTTLHDAAHRPRGPPIG